ncbi:hypothetical protein BT69DRAFT_817348 [Atractiella rhizophila]|nr:hypothetical protein BT69DRAFT_817348 [Atractiella rhizophila]
MQKRQSIFDFLGQLQRHFEAESTPSPDDPERKTVQLQKIPILLDTLQSEINLTLLSEQDRETMMAAITSAPTVEVTFDDMLPLLGQVLGGGPPPTQERSGGVTETGSPIPRRRRLTRSKNLTGDDDSSSNSDGDTSQDRTLNNDIAASLVPASKNKSSSGSGSSSSSSSDSPPGERPPSPFTATSEVGGLKLRETTPDPDSQFTYETPSPRSRSRTTSASSAKSIDSGRNQPSHIPRLSSSSVFANRQRSSPLVADREEDHRAGSVSPLPSGDHKPARRHYNAPTESSIRHAMSKPVAPHLRKKGGSASRAGSSEPLSPTMTHASISSGRKSVGGADHDWGNHPHHHAHHHHDDEGHGHDHGRSIPRDRSGGSVGMSDRKGRRTSDVSDTKAHSSHSSKDGSSHGVDNTSYHAAPISPPTSPQLELFDASPFRFPSDSPDFLRRQGSTTSSMGPGSRPTSVYMADGGATSSHNIRPDTLYGRDSIFFPHGQDRSPSGSAIATPNRPGSMLGNDAQIEHLRKTQLELSKKLMAAEKALEQERTMNEHAVEDISDKLEEARQELHALRRDKKELASKEQQNLIQITTLEAEISKLQKNLDKAREAHSQMRKQYDEQCGKSFPLSDMTHNHLSLSS